MECRAFFGLDNSQVPLPANMAVHSANLEIYIEQWYTSGGASQVDLTVYRVNETHGLNSVQLGIHLTQEPHGVLLDY